MPFRLANAPGIFQELMPIVSQDCGNFAMAYLDDIIIFSSSVKEHIRYSNSFWQIEAASIKIKTI